MADVSQNQSKHHSNNQYGDRIDSVADDVWIVDAPRIVAAGLPLPIRMTVIRLSSGDLLLHSPTQYARELHDRIAGLGRIRYLVAPNVAHWMFIQDWQAAVPDVLTFAAPGLAERAQVQRAKLHIDEELLDGEPEAWAGEVETFLIHGAFYTEVALFHRPSRSLILTDLVQNIDPRRLPIPAALTTEAIGSAAPGGMAPAYLRWLLRLGGRPVKEVARRLIALAPDRVIFAHGDWFDTAATERLAHSLRWLGRDVQEPRSNTMEGLRVVIAGASSGIGRAAALAFARRGATVVLAARRIAVLERLSAECEALGGRALAIETDVTDPDAVQRLASKVDQDLGGVDVWINNAGTGVFGAFQNADLALHRRTIEVNLLGTMYGSYAVLPIFLRQKSGVLINTISLGGWVPTPFAAAYTASKFGLRGFTSSLRQELADTPDVHVCGVFPAIIDTPGFIHGANHSGRTLDPGPLLYPPEDVAETFVDLVDRPRVEVAVGWPARAGQLSYALAPKITEQIIGAGMRRLLARAGQAPSSDGAMRLPVARGTGTSGGWLARRGLPPAGEISKLAVLAGVALLGVGAIIAGRRAREPGRG
ncbi:short chain dehydrogenase [Rhodopseudomonas sp. WA056]|uniref:SDR family oxidoreductase n=1 Tax=Rhodopseudomonas sp. WA056 TaxID=2269367 RepID=UPI0013DFBC9A|nr:SDR family oxidoreductase [Rhodopseudomonas sp. WA056]NEW87281.1 short chain dehydrogenase [Rhodopseudomonas sp. WA056]